MAKIDFSKEEREVIIRKLQFFYREELNQEIGQFDAEFLLDFFAEQVGVYFYNRGLYDAQAMLQSRLDSVTEAIYELEKPTDFAR